MKFARLTVVLLVLSVTSCGRQKEAGVRFGVILSLTGPAAPYGTDNQKGLQLAQEAINDAGGVNGVRVELDTQDDAGEPGQAVGLAKRYASDPAIIAILGPTRTGSTIAVAKLLPDLRVPMISVGSTGDWKSAAGDFNAWTFRSTRVDTHLIEPLLTAARDALKVHRIAAIYTANDDWSKSVMPVYEETIHKLGLELVAKESQMTGDTDRAPQLTRIREARPDALIINTLSSDAPTIANQARKIGITAQLLGTAGFTNPETWKLAEPGTLDGTLMADNYYPDSPRPAVRKFVDAYRRRFKAEPASYAAYAYDGLMLAAEAARTAKPHLTREAFRDSFGRISGFDGVLGTLTYSGSGDARKAPVILQIQGAKYLLFSPKPQ
ncbi:MAG: ABC transporter substrate-binding protein [Thermoanaerobaculia bacterium]